MIQKDDEYSGPNDKRGTAVKSTTVPLREGNVLVFNNECCYHRVSSMRIQSGSERGNRKIIAFFLIRPERHYGLTSDPDTTLITTNWRAHCGECICKWFGIESVDIDHGGSYEWLYHSIGEFMVGDQAFIRQKTEQHRRSRKVYSYQRFKKYCTDLNRDGRFDWHRQDW